MNKIHTVCLQDEEYRMSCPNNKSWLLLLVIQITKGVMLVVNHMSPPEEAAGVGLSVKDHQDVAPKPFGTDNLLLAFKSV